MTATDGDWSRNDRGHEPDRGDFRDRVVLVTGAGRGIGRAIALDFAARGASVAIHHFESVEAAGSVADDARRLGARAIVLAGDLTNPSVPSQLVDATVGPFGRLDVLVNNAGVYDATPLDAVSLEQWDRTFAINLRAVFLMCQAAAPHLRAATSAAIVNLASDGGLSPRPGFPVSAPYAISKAGVIMLTRLLAIDLAPEVRVNAVAPGVIESKAQPIAPKARARFASLAPLRTVGTPSDVASAVHYLASDAARFITGQVLAVDGGLLDR